MFFRGSIFFRILAVLLLAGILVAAGSAIYRAGFEQGTMQGLALAEGEVLPEGRIYPYGPGFFRPGFGFFPFFPFFGFFIFGFFLLFVIGGLFRPHRWGHPGYWHSHPHAWDDPHSGREPGRRGTETQGAAEETERRDD